MNAYTSKNNIIINSSVRWTNERRRKINTVNDLCSALVFGDDFWRTKIQLLLFPLFVRHRYETTMLLRL